MCIRDRLTFDNYVYVFKYPNVWQAYKNTIFITVVGTSLSLLLTSMGGYALSKRDLPYRMPMTVFVLITMFVGGGLIPTYLNLRNLGFLNTLWVMIIPDTISVSNLLLMRNFFLAQPEELKGKAWASPWQYAETELGDPDYFWFWFTIRCV